MNTSSNRLIDPRGPRFGAGITSVLILTALAFALPSAASPGYGAAWWLSVAITALFVWGALLGPSRHPYGWIFRAVIRPRMKPPSFMEEQAPPQFAQLVGLVVALTGVVLHLLGVPYGLVVALVLAFIASFLNAAFGLCLGCEMYALLLKWRGSRRQA